MRKQIITVSIFIVMLLLSSTVTAAIIVGRIAHVEGRIYRFMDVDQSWVETVVQSPAGTHDSLIAGNASRAEIMFPNNILVRLDQNAELQIMRLEEDVYAFTLHSGLARFSNLSTAASIKLETAMGTALLGPGSVADVQADVNSVVVAVVQGQATFQSMVDGVERVEILLEFTSLEFKADEVIAGRSPINRGWDLWCAERQEVWRQNRLVRSEYLPESMQEYGAVLETNGSWERIYFRGYYYWAWKPRYVSADWAPFTTGYWYDWQGSAVWIDNHPWGWVTCHHGHWLYSHGAWVWTPYVHVSYVPGITVIDFTISFGRRYRPDWYPGRVHWIANRDHIGWLPLAPGETYYGSRHWGPRTVVAHRGTGQGIGINFAHHSYIDYAVIIPKRSFSRREPGKINNYNRMKIKNLNRTEIIQNYRTVMFDDHKQRPQFVGKNSGSEKVVHPTINQPLKGTPKGVRQENRQYYKGDNVIRKVQMGKPGKATRSLGHQQFSTANPTGPAGPRREVSSQKKTGVRNARILEERGARIVRKKGVKLGTKDTMAGQVRLKEPTEKSEQHRSPIWTQEARGAVSKRKTETGVGQTPKMVARGGMLGKPRATRAAEDNSKIGKKTGLVQRRANRQSEDVGQKQLRQETSRQQKMARPDLNPEQRIHQEKVRKYAEGQLQKNATTAGQRYRGHQKEIQGRRGEWQRTSLNEATAENNRRIR